MLTGTVILAPLSKPTTVNVANKVEFEPNKVFTVVALKLIWVPVTVEDTLVPIVWVAVVLASVVAALCIPNPSKDDNTQLV